MIQVVLLSSISVLHWWKSSCTFLLCMEVILFCSVWKSSFFALYGSSTFLLSVKVALFYSLWKSYFFALYESLTFLLSMKVLLFCSPWKSYFFALYESDTFSLSTIQRKKKGLPLTVKMYDWKNVTFLCFRSADSYINQSFLTENSVSWAS